MKKTYLAVHLIYQWIDFLWEFAGRQKSCGFNTKIFSACWRYKPGFYFFSLHKINFINKLGKMFSIALTKTRNDLKRPTMSKKWSETTYNVQERTWNDLGQPRGRKTWCDLLWARNNLKQSTTSKGQPETTCIKQILNSWSPSICKIMNWRPPMPQRSNR